MVMTEKEGHGAVRLVIRPNYSLNWQGNKQFMAGISAVSLGIAGWFAWQGAWMILPFAGLELAALGTALYWVACKAMDTEVIVINDDFVEICKGRRQIESTIRLQRCWAQVRLEAANHEWYPSRLLIGSHGEHTEIGSFLGELEKHSLARELRRIV